MNTGLSIAKKLIPKLQFRDQFSFKNGNFEFNLEYANFARLRHITGLSVGN